MANPQPHSENTKTIVTILLLLFAYPIGLIVMWFWPKWKTWIKVLVTLPVVLWILAIIFIIFYAFFLRPFEVQGIAMIPNYKSGQYIAVSLSKLQPTPFERGNVIVYQDPETTRNYIKRIIGLPGETISIQNGKVFINGQELDESSYLQSIINTDGRKFAEEGVEIIIPENKYFVLGDNRPFSSDSRDNGFISQEDIIGTASFCYWNCSEK